MKTLEEFKQHFAENVHDNLTSLEEARSEMHNSRLKIGGYTLVAIFINWVAVAVFDILHPYTIGFTTLVAPATSFWIYLKHFHNNEIANDFKNQVVREMLSFMDDSLEYAPTKHVPYEEWQASRLFPIQPDHYTGDDFITGEIDGIPISLSEVLAMNRKKSKKKENKSPLSKLYRKYIKKKEKWDTMFHGIFLQAQYPETFKGSTFILPDTLQQYLGHVGRLVQAHNLLQGKYIHPHNYRFKQHYVVYSDNELHGEELLTNELMEKMLLLKRRGKCKVYCSLIGNTISVAVDLRKELFKVDTTRPLYNSKFVEAFYKEMLYVFSIIEDLNIDELELPSTEDEDDTSVLENFKEPEPFDQDMKEQEKAGAFDSNDRPNMWKDFKSRLKRN